MNPIQVGRLLRAGTTGFVAGCRTSMSDQPSLGALVRVPRSENHSIYGIIYDIHIDDDGLVRQLASSESVDEAVISDNRMNRNVPLEISVAVVGYKEEGKVSHLLPARPPLSLDMIFLCTPEEIHEFTTSGQLGYLRHLLRINDAPIGELTAIHIVDTARVNSSLGDQEWLNRATRELIVLLRDDYPTLMAVLSALGESN